MGADVHDGKAGLLEFIDRTGKVVVPAQFPVDCGQGAQLRTFREGPALVMGAKGGHGHIDQTGRFVIPPQYWDTGDFHDGFASIAVRPYGGANAAAEWIDHTGKAVFRRQYHLETANLLAGPPSARTDFSEGMLRLREDDVWGFVDRTFR